MADETINPVLGHCYSNRVSPNLVVKVTKIKDGEVSFVFMEGLREGYPKPSDEHVMRYYQFVRYYRLAT